MTDGVRQLVKDSGFPNMKVIQFAFDSADIGGSNEYLPHNYINNCVVYTGTHDNETIYGWFSGLDEKEQAHIREYLDDQTTPTEKIHEKLIRLGMLCAADVCIVPIQDWLGLDNSARMNTPGTVDNNWTWRMKKDLIPETLGEEILALTKRYGRANWDALNALEEAEAEDDEIEVEIVEIEPAETEAEK